MRKLIGSLLLLLAATTTLADTKISQLPLDSAGATNVNDSFPFVNSVIGETERLLLSDLPNLPAMQSQFSLMVPSQTGQNGKCLQSNGTLTLWGTCSLGSVTSVGLLDASTTPLFSLSGTPVTSTGTLTFTLKTQTANTVLAGPTTGAAAQPGFRSLVGADLPNPGASSLGGVESLSCSSSNWLNQINTSGVPACSQPAFSDISSTLNLSSQVTNTLAATHGGTGQTSIAAAFVSFYESVATTLGDIIYGGASGTPSRLAGNTTSTTKYLTQTGDGVNSAAPSWTQPACSNLSNAAASCSTDATNAANISSGLLALARGGAHADLSGTGGASQVLKQTSVGGNISVARLACADLSNSVASCSTDATVATNITSGNLPLAQLPSAVTWPSSGTVQSVTPAVHGVVVSGASTTATVLGAAAAGTVLTGQGASADPSFSSTPTLGIAGTSTGSIALAGSTSNAVTLSAQNTAGNVTFKLPNTVGTSGQFLKTDGNAGTATLSWGSTSGTFTAPTVQRFTSTGTTTGYLFTISTSSTVAVNDTYTNNGNTYTVLNALTAQTGQVLFTSGASAPTASGTLTRSAGAGTASITFTSDVALATYTTPANVLYVRVKLVGGGGGGACSNGSCSGGSGTTSTFGPNLLLATGGVGATSGNSNGGAGGSTTTNSGPSVMQSISGGSGGGSGINGVSSSNSMAIAGGMGGSSFFGGAGGSGTASTSGQNASANTGSGGGGGGTVAVVGANSPGAGGGAGGYIDATFSSPAATYVYAVGTGGSGGSGGSGNGGNGAAGQVVVEEYYQ